MNRIIFIGSGKFAVPFLEFLVKKKDIEILAVITQPDKHGGRGKKLLPTPVKEFALKCNLKLLQPMDINSQEIIDFIKSNDIKLNVVISYSQILKKELIYAPEYNSINVHPSLLPKYRGASPIQNVLLNGEGKTGISIIEINEEMDAGDILAQKEVKIDIEDDFYSLSERLIDTGRELLYETIQKIFNNAIKKIHQNDIEATYCRKISKKEGLIKWNENSLKIYNQIRALVHWPVAYTYFKGKMVKIYKSKLTDKLNTLPAGSIYKFNKKNFGVVCGDKKILKIEKLQPQGKKIISASDFINGYKIETGDMFQGEPR